MTRCKNCETPFEGNYCPQCGQRNVDLERPLSELVSEVVHEAFDIDGRAIRTVWTLFRRPGVLTSEFLAGRRKLYSPPFRLYLVISLAFFLVAAWVAGQGILLDDGQTLESDALGQERFLSVQVPRLMFVLLPVFALMLKAAFRQRPYFHHLIHALHLHSAAYVVLAFMLPLERVATDFTSAMVIQVLLLGYLIANLVVSLRHVYRASWLAAAGKAGALSMLYMMVITSLFEAASFYESAGIPRLTD